MKKVFLFSLLSLLVVGQSGAVSAPTDARGESLGTIDFIGAQIASIDAATGTSLVVINSTGTGAISTGRAIVYGVITSSVAQGDYLVLRDTTGANGSVGVIANQTALATVSSAVVVSNTFFGIQSTGTAQPNYPSTNIIKFPVPIQFRNGIVAQTSAAPVTNGFSRWTILYRKIDQSER